MTSKQRLELIDRHKAIVANLKAGLTVEGKPTEDKDEKATTDSK